MNIQINKTVLKRYFINSNSNKVLLINIVHILTIHMYCHLNSLQTPPLTLYNGARCLCFIFEVQSLLHVSQFSCITIFTWYLINVPFNCSRDILLCGLMYNTVVYLKSLYVDWCTLHFTLYRNKWIDIQYNCFHDIVICGWMYFTIIYVISLNVDWWYRNTWINAHYNNNIVYRNTWIDVHYSCLL